MQTKYIQISSYLKFFIALLLATILIAFVSCTKFLDKKPNKSQFVPGTLDDLQALLHNRNLVMFDDPIMSEFMSDNIYLRDADWQYAMSSSTVEFVSAAQHYIWDGNAIPYENSWNAPYQGKIYVSNLVLDYVDKVVKNAGEDKKYNYVKGAALFLRAFAFERLTHLYCKPYDESTSVTDLGLVLRETSAIDVTYPRSTVQQTYDLILRDLKEAASLLPGTKDFPTQPNKAAAFGALARTYLSMRNYEMAGKYANDALQMNHQLMDYNDLIPISDFPLVPLFNPEIIFHSTARNTIFIANDYASIASDLTSSYDVNDLRMEVYFAASYFPGGPYAMWGSYASWDPSGVFEGIATDELYLIRAECYAKAGKTAEAMADLNGLMEKRWLKNQFTPFTANTATEALQKIRTERRKELVYRGHRWSDIRRYNMEDSAITLKRTIAGNPYTLPPNDKRSVILIPLDVIKLSGVAQNPR